jgi:hypothetical protein
MPSRRLEDRIRELCGRLVYESGPDWERTVHELQVVIRQHAWRLANVTTTATVGGKPDVFIERRGLQRG